MKKVLIMEDEVNIRSFVVINLKRAGFDTIEAGTGAEALQRLKEHPDIGVAILDVEPKGAFYFFTDTTELIELAGRMMRLMAVGYLGVAITQSLGGVMRGCGNTVTPMWISIVSTVALRIPVAYILAYFSWRCTGNRFRRCM